MFRSYVPRHAAPVPARRRMAPFLLAAVALMLGTATQADAARAAIPAGVHQHVDHAGSTGSGVLPHRPVGVTGR